MKDWLDLVGWPVADSLPTWWSPVGCRQSAVRGQYCSLAKDWRSANCAMQPVIRGLAKVAWRRLRQDRLNGACKYNMKPLTSPFRTNLYTNLARRIAWPNLIRLRRPRNTYSYRFHRPPKRCNGPYLILSKSRIESGRGNYDISPQHIHSIPITPSVVGVLCWFCRKFISLSSRERT